MKKLLVMKNYLSYILLFISLSGFNFEGNAQVNVLWESRFTSAGTEEDAGKEIAIDASGNVYVTGTSYTNVTNGYDIVTIKYDALGAQQWTATFNGTGSALDEGRDIAVDKNGNVYVTGYTASSGPNYDYVTIMYNASGAQQWATTYNGTGNGYDEAFSLAIDTNGNTYVTGTSDAGSQSANFVTIKYNSTGVQQWATSYNGPGNLVDAATQIKLDSTFNVYVSGRSYGSGTDLDIATIKYNNSGAQQWVSRYDGALNFFDDPEALFIDHLNNVYVAGATYGGLATENDFVTIKINSTGTQQWARTYDGPQNEEDKAFDVLVDLNSDVYVTGRSMGSGSSAENMHTIKYDPAGNVLWQDTYNGPASGYDDAQQMRLGASGYLYVTGYSAGNGTNNDYLTLKYDTSNANIEWEARFDGPASNSDQAFAMEIDAAESIYVTGTSTDPASFKDYSTIKWCQLETDAGNDTAICAGASIQLNATGGTNFVWSPGSNLSNPNVPNPTASPSVTTVYTVSSTNALGCVDFDTLTITVNPLPSNNITVTDSNVFCAGDSAILTVDPSLQYAWLPSGDTTQSTVAHTSGTYSVTVTDTNSCSDIGQVVVTVNSLPTVSAGSDANLCNGSSMMLNATGAQSYTWNTQTTLSDSTIANPIINPTTPTTYWVIGEDSNGCKNTDSVIIAISIAPTAVIDTPVPNDTLYLLQVNGGDIQFFGNLSTNVVSYAWDFGDGGNDVVQNPIYTYTSAGLWPVELITTNGGCHDTAYINIMVYNTTGLDDINDIKNITLHPNPANNYITISLDGHKLSSSNVELYNYAGKLVKRIAVNEEAKQLRIITSDMPNGVYFIRLTLEGQETVRKLTVLR